MEEIGTTIITFTGLTPMRMDNYTHSNAITWAMGIYNKHGLSFSYTID